MGEAIALARSMQGKVWPNPPVGCVIVREGEIVGRGCTQFGGRPHAERMALDQAGERARDAALYVTLEPCCHWGKTPPCADAIIRAGVRAVHASLQDPDPRVDGNGFRKLREAGIRVGIGLAENEASQIMAGFFHRIATGHPLLRVGARPQAAHVIPEGFDALMHSGWDCIEVVIRTPQGEASGEPLDSRSTKDELLDELGRRGLTSVYVPIDDPLSWKLRTAPSTTIASFSATHQRAGAPHTESAR
ncbi:bifunctional diaminohydroxyphosphoribosylaminopyrimidine deaminase/5-amino-6-(5-phosphoribosylamino)uracil reductase RibD [Methyloligella sp. GL2]|nr:bifunctional diaminohydroxyphosphoribosylaminopyrimidine deaminase/5-amino-6-(5-phosphoribosylamino)uracil reductase RibD [Methyloligella sp. GL2]